MLAALSEDGLIKKEFYGTVLFTQIGVPVADQLYTDYLTLFAFFHRALNISEFYARKNSILCLCGLSKSSQKIAAFILEPQKAS